MADKVFIGVGSNLNPEEHILKALDLLMAQVVVSAASGFYTTKPLGIKPQPDYINGVWQIKTGCTPRELKSGILRQIEHTLGRAWQADKYAARCIDLDLLLYDNLVIADEDFQLPDPDIYTRNFIAIPLYELDPSLVLPGTGMPVADLVKGMDTAHMDFAFALTGKIRQRISNL